MSFVGTDGGGNTFAPADLMPGSGQALANGWVMPARTLFDPVFILTAAGVARSFLKMPRGSESMTITREALVSSPNPRGTLAASPGRARDTRPDRAAVGEQLRTLPPRDEYDPPEINTLLDLKELVEDHASLVAATLRGLSLRLRIPRRDAGWLVAVWWILDQMPRIRTAAQRDEYHLRLEQIHNRIGKAPKVRFARTIDGLLLVPLALRIMEWDRSHGR